MAGNNTQRFFAGMTRNCARCGHTFVITEKMVERGQYPCGPCDSRRAVNWARRNRETKRANNSAYLSAHPDQRAKKNANYRKAHPDRARAHYAVQTAIRNGSLIRQSCSVCADKRSHAHHDDYSKMLDVVWLFHTHHMERHSMLRAREEAPK